MTVENLLSHQFIEAWLSFHAPLQLYCCKQKQKLLSFERHRHVDFANRKVHISTEDVALLTKIFMGKKANLVNFIWFVKYFFNVFCSRFKFEKNVFKMDMPPSFYYGGFLYQYKRCNYFKEKLVLSCTYNCPN